MPAADRPATLTVSGLSRSPSASLCAAVILAYRLAPHTDRSFYIPGSCSPRGGIGSRREGAAWSACRKGTTGAAAERYAAAREPECGVRGPGRFGRPRCALGSATLDARQFMAVWPFTRSRTPVGAQKPLPVEVDHVVGGVGNPHLGLPGYVRDILLHGLPVGERSHVDGSGL